MPLDPRIPLQIQHFDIGPAIDEYYRAVENKRRTNAQRLADMAAQQQLELNEAEISEMLRKRKEAEELRKILGEAYGLEPEGESSQPGGGFQGYPDEMGSPKDEGLRSASAKMGDSDAILRLPDITDVVTYGANKLLPDIPWSGSPTRDLFFRYPSPEPVRAQSPRESVESTVTFPGIDDESTAGQFQERDRGAKNFGKLSDWYEAGIQAPPEPRTAERATSRESAVVEKVLPEPRAEAKPETPKQTRIPGHLSEDQIRRIGRINPEMAGKIRREQQAEVVAAENARLNQKKSEAELVEKQFAIAEKRVAASREMLVGILNIPEADRPAAYQRVLFSMQKMGIDIGQMPTRYNEAFVKEQVAGLASYARTLQESRQEDAEKRAQGEYDATIEGKRADSTQKQADAEFAKKDPEGLTRSQRIQRDRDIARDKEQREYRQQQLELQRQRLNKASGGVGTWTPLTDDQGQITGFFNSKTRQIDTNVPEGLRKSAARQPTSAEARAAGFYNRAEGASQNAEALEESIASKGTVGQVYQQYAPNVIQTSENQLYEQAIREFTEARLRKDSGAVIKDSEMEQSRKTYFPVAGDSKQVLAQKRQARQRVLESLKAEAGKAMERLDGAKKDETKQESSKPKIQILKVE